jgi:MraZ protein
MFLGEYTHTVDDKGRVTIPARFRAELATGLVVTRGLDRNLMIYPLEEWEKLADKVMSKPMTDPSVRNFRRRLFSGAMDLTLDRQGRILLPPYLREFADIDGEVVVVGNYNYIEIWNTEGWTSARHEMEDSDDDFFALEI